MLDRLKSWLKGPTPQADAEHSTAETEQAPADGLRMTNIKLRVGKCTNIGYYRDNNEDRMYVDELAKVYIVADGMGGQAAGEQASQLAIEMIPQELQTLPETSDPHEVKRAVSGAVVAANEAILARGMADPSVQNMGTTVVLAVLRGGQLFIAHIGDSRAYRLRGNRFDSITTDHNLAQALYQAKTITKEELKTHRFKHVLWKYLGSKEAEDGPDIEELTVQPGDRFMLATDGLTGALEEDVLRREIARHDDPQRCADDLVRLALENGSKDNVTCIVLFADAE